MAMSTRRLADGGVVFLMDTAEGYLRVDADVAGNVRTCEVQVRPAGHTMPAPPRRAGCCGDKSTLPRTAAEAERDLVEGLTT